MTRLQATVALSIKLLDISLVCVKLPPPIYYSLQSTLKPLALIISSPFMSPVFYCPH